MYCFWLICKFCARKHFPWQNIKTTKIDTLTRMSENAHGKGLTNDWLIKTIFPSTPVERIAIRNLVLCGAL